MSHRIPVAVLLAALCGLVATQQTAAQQTAAPQTGAQPASPAATAQQPPVTYLVEVNFVEVDAFVTDAQGNTVTNLTAADFELLEDGRQQKVASFSLVNIPIQRAERALFATQPVEADVQTNEHVEGRVYLLVLDDLHTDPIRAPRVKAAARRFIEQSFGVNDVAAVVYTGGRANDSQEFTNNPRLLLRAIDKFTGRKFRSATINQLENTVVDPQSGALVAGPDIDRDERAFRARSVMGTIRKLADFMAGVRGRRKAVLLIGEGVDYDIFQAVGLAGSTASSVIQDTHDAIAAATRGNVSLYTIDPRGLLAGTEDLISVSSTMEDQGVGTGSIQSEMRRSQDSLRVLAANTGGFAAVNRNDMDTAFDRIVAENSSYYMLGFYATNERRDGRFRKLEVRLKRPGLRVRSRSGYYEARGRAPAAPAPAAGADAMNPAVGGALGSPLPMAGLPIRVFAAPFKGTAPNASLAISIEMDASRFDFIEKDGLFTETLDVAFTALEANGKVFAGDRHSVALALKPDTHTRAMERGVRVLSQHNVPPGRYQLRVAAGNRTGTAIGSVLYDVEVPDFYKLPLSMSGVALTSTAAGQAATVKAKDPLAEFLPGPATTAREFQRNESIALFVEFYEGQGDRAAHMLEFKAELRAEGGRVVRESTEERSSTEIKGSSGGYGFGARFTFEDLDPGLYVLHVQGQAQFGERPTVSRDIQIRIR
jgi:VWFA-related protein